MSTNTPNTIDLYLMENRSIMAKVNGYPIGNQNGYLIIAGEENATQFKITSIPDIYSGYTLSVEMVNSRGAGIEEKEIEDNTFVLPEGMAVAGYGQIQIYAKKAVSSREIKVPFNLIRVKVSNTISTWEESISPGAVESAKKSAAEAKSYAAEAKKDSESAATAASVAESSKEAAESAAQEATQSAQSASESASTAQNAAEEAVNTLEGKLDKTTGTGAVPRAYTVSETGEQSMTDLNSGIVPRTIVYRNATGYFDVLDPAQYTNPVSLRYYNQNVPTAVQEGFATQTALANTQRQVDGLYTLLEQKNEIYVQTATDTYTTRETAGGENIADGVQTPVKKITGKTVKTTNLIPYPYYEKSKTINGVTFTINNDGSVLVNGTATANTSFILFFNRSDVMGLTVGEKYKCSMLGSSEECYLYADFYSNGEWHYPAFTSQESFNEFVVPSDWEGINLYILVANGSVISNFTVYPMLNEGSTALPYKPYFSGLKNAFFKEIVSTGKNLIPYPYAKGTDTLNGVTFTVNNDGTIIANGTATENAIFIFHNFDFSLSAGTYTISGLENGGADTYCLQISRDNYTESWNLYNGNIQFNLENTSSMLLQFVVYKGASVNNVVLKPMLNYGSSALPYEPYTQSVLSLPEAVELTEYDTAYPETGEIQRQSNTLTFNGTETWYTSIINDCYAYYVITKPVGFSRNGLISNKITTRAHNAISGQNEGCYMSNANFNAIVFWFLQTAYPNLSTSTAWKSQLAAWNEAGNPLTVTYKTAETTTEQADFSADSYIAWKNGSETIEQGNTDNSIYGAENTVEQDYYLLTAPEEVTKE